MPSLVITLLFSRRNESSTAFLIHWLTCQSPTPVKTLRRLEISRRGAYWRFDFDANAFLHHMVRNLMGCLLAVGSGRQRPEWMAEVLAAREGGSPQRNKGPARF